MKRSIFSEEQIACAPWKLLCVTCCLERNPGKRRSTEPVAVAAGAGIEPAMLRRLIQLCHPDKHQGSEAATTATRYLLALRGEARPCGAP